jgi:hypothetical protein
MREGEVKTVVYMGGHGENEPCWADVVKIVKAGHKYIHVLSLDDDGAFSSLPQKLDRETLLVYEGRRDDVVEAVKKYREEVREYEEKLREARYRIDSEVRDLYLKKLDEWMSRNPRPTFKPPT